MTAYFVTETNTYEVEADSREAAYDEVRGGAEPNTVIEMQAYERYPDYEALGIFHDTWACVLIEDRRKAQAFLWELAIQGVPALVSRDPDGERYHVAVQGGLPRYPIAWVTSLRGSDEKLYVTCTSSDGQHARG